MTLNFILRKILLQICWKTEKFINVLDFLEKDLKIFSKYCVQGNFTKSSKANIITVIVQGNCKIKTEYMYVLPKKTEIPSDFPAKSYHDFF